MRTSLGGHMNQVLQDEVGAALVEYAVALLVVVAVGLAAFTTMGTRVAGLSGSACESFHGMPTQGC